MSARDEQIKLAMELINHYQSIHEGNPDDELLTAAWRLLWLSTKKEEEKK